MKYRENRQLDIDHIHIYGCSMPAGHEINDPQIKQKMWSEERQIQAREKNKKESWPAVFADLLGVTYTNNAQYGASNGDARGKLTTDILGNKIKNNHAVFFCPTIISRVNTFDPIGGKPMSYQLHELDNTLMDFYNDYKILFDYFTDLYTVLTLVKAVGAPCYFIPMFTPVTYDSMQSYAPYHPDIDWNDAAYAWQELKGLERIMRELNDLDTGIIPFNQWVILKEGSHEGKYRYSGGHPKQHMHVKYGKILYDLLRVEDT